MKKFIVVLTMLLLALAMFGCSRSESTSESTTEDVTVATETETVTDPSKEVDLDNLAVGETVEFSDYSITVNDVTSDGTNLTANVTMEAYKNSSFAVRYMDAITSEGKKVSAVSQPTKQVNAGETYTATLVYPENNIASLRWDNWSNEAQWNFDPTPRSTADTNINNDSNDSDMYISDAWALVEQYGESVFPYGFRIHMITGTLAEEQVDDDTWFLKVYCDVKNEYGTWQKNLNCEAYVTWNGSNWIIDSFNVY